MDGYILNPSPNPAESQYLPDVLIYLQESYMSEADTVKHTFLQVNTFPEVIGKLTSAHHIRQII